MTNSALSIQYSDLDPYLSPIHTSTNQCLNIQLDGSFYIILFFDVIKFSNKQSFFSSDLRLCETPFIRTKIEKYPSRPGVGFINLYEIDPRLDEALQEFAFFTFTY